MKIGLVVCEVEGFVMGKIEVGLEEVKILMVVVENDEVGVVGKTQIAADKIVVA